MRCYPVGRSMPVDSKAPIKNMADMEAWNPPDPHVPHRLAAMIERIARFKGRRAILVPLRNVWSNPRDLLGYEELWVFGNLRGREGYLPLTPAIPREPELFWKYQGSDWMFGGCRH